MQIIHTVFSLFVHTRTDDDDIPEELLLGKQQLSELASDSAKVKAMGIFNTVKTTLGFSIQRDTQLVLSFCDTMCLLIYPVSI